MFQKDAPVRRQRFIDFAQAFEVAFKGAAKVHLAGKIPAAMLFLRSPGGVSHHPDENVRVEDVKAALHAGMNFLEQWETRLG